MVFEATVQERHDLQPALRGTAKTLLMLTVGVFIGLMLAETSTNEHAETGYFSTGEIVGEDWHGNVRRSSHVQ